MTSNRKFLDVMTDDTAPETSRPEPPSRPTRDRRRLKNGRLSARERRRLCRAAAKFSTGPRTLTGKRASSMSACTHGLRIENLAILTEKAPEVKAKLNEYVDYYKPSSPGERELCVEQPECVAHAVVKRRQIAPI